VIGKARRRGYILFVTQAPHIASPPAKPLMIYDGDCNFCKFWIIRWQRATAGRVDYIASQDPRVAQQFPELLPEQFAQAVQLIQTNGVVASGAEAVFLALQYHPLWRWPLWLYDSVPGVKPLTEWAYAFVAARRAGFSFLTRLLWGRGGALPEYTLVRGVFLRLLGLAYLSAFVSLGIQITGLMGSDGILPVKQLMVSAQTQCDQMHVGLERYHILPTLCWFNTSDTFLKSLCAAGSVLSLLLIADVAPAICLFLLWLIYLSLESVGGEFLSFQWDILLLEVGFLAMWIAPPQLFPWRGRAAPPSRAMLWLLRWLLFRLMFESGLVKLLSGDPNWHNLTALNFHYETQPLPTWIGWYAHQLSADVQKMCVAIMFIIELIVPFLIFAPRRLRFLGCGAFVLLQGCILLTGNYCFFNLLTISLCVLLLDDAFLRRLFPARWGKRSQPKMAEQPAKSNGLALPEISVPAEPISSGSKRAWSWPTPVIALITIVILLISIPQVLGMVEVGRSWLQPLLALEGWASPFRSVNTYGLFAVMTTERREIIIQGSNDGQTWLDYEFKYKPGDPKRRPAFVAPHQPRLDWQMWFAALGTYRENGWLMNFCVRLLQGSPPVLGLLEHNPFPAAPPRYIRAVVYDYHFTNREERNAQGTWWRREYLGEYLPQISLRKDQ